ncbi:MBL fold metallo-hydrolase [Haloarchaeobius iranensis]|uniref:Putative mRNA 3-end processing factor n=1 Tax=Haloarchaeobius iranensis TaxID=996166 RepID=A0A1G9ZJP3_9EURY|nr:MBL fold metallo-hydrolase [Haloarchaeobius iranensis]SDN20816.1 putative mRNA 3-end processing factor [Haloarchaeobius iranensis]
MEIRFLGGAREIGRSAILVDDSLLLDYGMASGNPPQYPVDQPEPDAVVVSHGHLDHVGAVPSLLSGDERPPIHWTPPTAELARVLARDTLKLHGGSYDCPFTEAELKRLTEVSHTHGYRQPFEAAGYEVTFFDAGHIPGSAHVLVDSAGRSPAGDRTQSDDDGDTRLLYTADFHTEDQRLLGASRARPDADVVVVESTYSDTERESRPAIEHRFVESVTSTVWEGGTVVVPAFGIGRTQEMLCILGAHDVDCYVDGMGKDVTRLFQRHDGFVRDAETLRRGASNARFVTGKPGQRERIAQKNTVIVTTSGMLHGGPAMAYVPEIRSSPTNKVAFTGFQVPGTPGHELLERGRAEFDGRILPVAAQTEQHDFSAHADSDGLWEFLGSYRDAQVLVNHGDNCEDFAAELVAGGFDAAAPRLDETVEV